MVKTKWIIGGAVVLTFGAGLIGWLWLSRPLFSHKIRQQVNFVILYPANSSVTTLDRKSIKYDSTEKILTYNASIGTNQLIVTNQATPSNFTDIPQLFDKVIGGMHPYVTFDSSNGKVSLTRPPNTNNQQVAVLNNHGTLMFVRANHDLSEDQWRKFFNNLNELK